MRRARYRAAQFFRHLWPRPLSPADQAAVRAILNPSLLALFQRQSPAEQAHSLGVLRALQARGHTEPALLQAALLHDVGKTRAPLSLPERVGVVLAQRWLPAASARWGRLPARGWRRAFAIAACHAQWGADLCAQAGAPPLTVELVRRHQTPVPAPLTAAEALLCALQQADDDH